MNTITTAYVMNSAVDDVAGDISIVIEEKENKTSLPGLSHEIFKENVSTSSVSAIPNIDQTVNVDDCTYLSRIDNDNRNKADLVLLSGFESNESDLGNCLSYISSSINTNSHAIVHENVLVADTIKNPSTSATSEITSDKEGDLMGSKSTFDILHSEESEAEDQEMYQLVQRNGRANKKSKQQSQVKVCI
jgi:hypothetical protein